VTDKKKDRNGKPSAPDAAKAGNGKEKSREEEPGLIIDIHLPPPKDSKH
jgi:hypothetical protein